MTPKPLQPWKYFCHLNVSCNLLAPVTCLLLLAHGQSARSWKLPNADSRCVTLFTQQNAEDGPLLKSDGSLGGLSHLELEVRTSACSCPPQLQGLSP